MKDRVAGAPGQYKATVAGAEFNKLQNGEPFAITLQRDDKPEVEGTPYSKAAVLPDDLAHRLCPNLADPSPADALKALSNGMMPSISIAIDSWDDATNNGFYYGREGTPEGKVWFGIVSNAPDNRYMQLIWRERTADEVYEDGTTGPKIAIRYWSSDMETWESWCSIDCDVWERVSWLFYGGDDFDMRSPAEKSDIDNWIYIGGTNSEEYMCSVSEVLSAEDMMMYVPCPFDSEEDFHNIQITVNRAELLDYTIEEGELIIVLGSAQESGNIPVTVNVRTYCSGALY